jgi:hypothetical protein
MPESSVIEELGVSGRFAIRPNHIAKLQQSQMVGILRLQSAHQELKFRKTAKILEARVFHEKRPARKSSADTALQPLKGGVALPGQSENACDLIIGVVRVPKGFRTRTSPGHAVECRFDSPR